MTNKSEPFHTSEYALLGFLVAGPCHGYDLHKRLTDAAGIGMVWGVKIANMYAQLDKLARKRYITGTLQANDQRPARMEYSLTATGEAEFNRWLTQLVEHPRDFRHEFMTRVYFLSLYHPAQLEDLVSRQLEVCQQWLKNTVEKEDSTSQSTSFENLTIHFRLTQIQSIVEWLKWLLIQIPHIETQRGEK